MTTAPTTSNPAPASHPAPSSASPRILVVDDEPPILELVTGYLEREGWEVRLAADGAAALDTVRAWNPDAVILDLMLPGADGLEVCRELRTFSPAHVLLLTARCEEADRIAGLAAGADDYLAKPFSPRELVTRMRRLLTPQAPDPVQPPADAAE